MREMEIQGATTPQGIYNDKYNEWFHARVSVYLLKALIFVLKYHYEQVLLIYLHICTSCTRTRNL